MTMFNVIAADSGGWQAGWSMIEALATALGVVATLIVAVFALFPEWTRGRIYRAKAQLRCGNQGFFFQAAHGLNQSPLYAVRLQVLNIGNALATYVECHLLGIAVESQNNWVSLAGFVPMRLRMTHTQNTASEYLARETALLVDLGTLAGDQGQFATGLRPTLYLKTEVQIPSSILPPGHYQLDVTVTSKERVLWKGSLDLSFTTTWAPPSSQQQFAAAADFQIANTRYTEGIGTN